MPTDALLVISCNENSHRIDPSNYFNLSAAQTQVIKTSGGRVEGVINNIYYADQTSPLGMVVIVQHTQCHLTTSDVEANVRNDMQLLKSSPYVRKEILIVGYVLDVDTGKLREVKYVNSSSSSLLISVSVLQNPVMPLLWHAIPPADKSPPKKEASLSPTA